MTPCASVRASPARSKPGAFGALRALPSDSRGFSLWFVQEGRRAVARAGYEETAPQRRPPAKSPAPLEVHCCIALSCAEAKALECYHEVSSDVNAQSERCPCPTLPESVRNGSGFHAQRPPVRLHSRSGICTNIRCSLSASVRSITTRILLFGFNKSLNIFLRLSSETSRSRSVKYL